MTKIDRESVERLAEYLSPDVKRTLLALRAALDEAEARAVKFEKAWLECEGLRSDAEARADRAAQEARALALQEAMKNLRSHLGRLAYDVMQVEDCILDLITPDMQSALDSVVREAEARVRAEVVRSMTEASIYALECEISRHEALGNGAVVEALREMLDQERAASTEGEG